MGYYRYITNYEMESITYSILKENDLVPRFNNITRIDIDYLIEFVYDLDIEFRNINKLSDDKHDVLAVMHPSNKKIYMNAMKQDLFMKNMGTMNFTKAHELGHWILHVIKEQDYQQLDFSDNDKFFCRGENKYDPREIQANMFAASLLMPEILLNEYINNIKCRRKINFRDLYSLKNILEVSITALVRRLNELKILYITKDKKIFNNMDESLGQLGMF